jgi:AraC family transcriptional regulator
MSTRLNAGQYFGSVLRRLELPSVRITETFYPPFTRLPAHAHRSAYFCCVRNGRYEETYGSRSRHVGPLAVVYHPAEEMHSERMGDAVVRSLNVEVDHGWMAGVRSAAAAALRDPVEAHGGPPAWLAARIYRELVAPDATTALMVEGLLLELVAELARSAKRVPGGPRWMNRVRDLLRARFRENVSLSELAHEAGVHPVHLAGVFRRTEGCTVGEYLRARRVEHAAALMGQPDVPLAEVAVEAGFSDQSHLTRLFKRATGLTPAQFRRTRA